MPQLAASAKGKTFLVVDADRHVVSIVRRYLSSEGARQIFVEESTRSAIDVLATASPPIDCVICAEDVAPFTGIEFLKGIRSGKYSSIPYVRTVTFVMVTAHRERELVEACKALSVDGYIVKPLDVTSFRNHLHLALGRQKALADETEYMSVDVGKAARLPIVLRKKWAESVKPPENRKPSAKT